MELFGVVWGVMLPPPFFDGRENGASFEGSIEFLG